MTALDFPPDDCRHPRHRGLRLAGRWAALEVVAIGAAFAAIAGVDLAVTQTVTTLRRIRTPRGAHR